jgi:hypothetical protein
VGDVIAVTRLRSQPVRGGPTGQLRLLFIHVRIAAGHTSLVRRRLQPQVVPLLLEKAPLDARVGVILSAPHTRTIRLFGTRVLNGP